MAEQVTKDVVKEAQSVGRPAPIDDTASTTSNPAVNGEPPSGTATTNSTTSKHNATAANATSGHAASADSTAAVCSDGEDMCVSALTAADYGRAEASWNIAPGL
jgi:hypothetical protein